MTTVAIMQPYFLPYLGYWQLMDSADVFVLYDDIEYSKRGWINRNRIEINGRTKTISIPLAKGSDKEKINEKQISQEKKKLEQKYIVQMRQKFSKCSGYASGMPIIKSALQNQEDLLVDYLEHSIFKIREYLEIDTTIVRSSSLAIDSRLNGEDRVINICKTLGATRYINLPGGKNLYSKETFMSEGIDISFIETEHLFNEDFPCASAKMSIAQSILTNTKEEIRACLKKARLS